MPRVRLRGSAQDTGLLQCPRGPSFTRCPETGVHQVRKKRSGLNSEPRPSRLESMLPFPSVQTFFTSRRTIFASHTHTLFLPATRVLLLVIVPSVSEDI